MNETTFDIDIWKMQHPMFHEKLSFDEIQEVQFSDLTKEKELSYLKKILIELTILYSDPQINAKDLFPHMVNRLITKRIKELEK